MNNNQKQEIFTKYMEWVDMVSEDLEDKTYFTPEEIVDKVISLCEEVFGKELDSLYSRIEDLEYDKIGC